MTRPKDGLVRSLWRAHQEDAAKVQFIAALCLDFQVADSGVWAKLLLKLRSFEAYAFLLDLIVALHDKARAPGA